MKRLFIALLLVFVLCLPIFAQADSVVKIPEKDIIELIARFGVQVRIPVAWVYRDVTFYKYEKGNRLTEKKIDKLNDDEKRWYAQGYIVQYGEWIGDDFKERDQLIKTAIYGSGTLIYSSILPEALQSKSVGKVVGTYAETLVLTNYHVVAPIVDRYKLGSKSEPINVYEEIDLVTTIDPPTIKFREGARPTQQKYFTLLNTEGEPCAWVATKNTSEIRVKLEQNYEISGRVVGYDKGLDVGIISIKNVAFQPYAKFRTRSCEVGEKVWIRHCPLALRFSTDRGYVNQVGLDLGVDEDGLGWNDQVKLDIPSAPGSSGSGIFDEEGYLIALFHGGLIHQMGKGYSFIEGGHLAHEGTAVAEWLNWRGFSYIFEKDMWRGQQELLDKLELAEQLED